MANSTDRVDVYTRVTDQIVKAIEQGAGAWEMPWHSPEVSFQYPVNVATGKRYRGVNVISLWASSYLAGYPEAVWGTFKRSLGIFRSTRPTLVSQLRSR